MRLADEVDLRVRSRRNDGPYSSVWINGQPSGTVVRGLVLEGAVQCARGWLLLVTGDTPSEEMLNIYFLDDHAKLLDAACIGGPYATGLISDLHLDPPANVCFRFIDDADWSVRVLETARYTLPWWPDARGVWRGARLTRWFDIHRRQSSS